MGKRGWDRPSVRWGISRNDAAAEGFRSTFECAIGRQLREAGVEFEYEAATYPVFVRAGRSYSCEACKGPAVKLIQYTPDFFFNNRTFVVEAKGRFDVANRIKALAFRQQYPDLEYALLFEENNRISRTSTTSYMDWATKHNILSACGLFPSEWLKEVR